jgi:hypothetical protein
VGREYFEQIGVGFELPNHYLASLYSKKSRDPMELLAMVGLDGHAKKKVEEFSKGRVSAQSTTVVPRRADGWSRPRECPEYQDHY